MTRLLDGTRLNSRFVMLASTGRVALVALACMACPAHAFGQNEQPPSEQAQGETSTPDQASDQAQAQTANEDQGEIVITGTSLRGTAPVGTQPVTLSREDITQLAPSNTVDILRSVPQINNLGADESRVAGSQGGSQNNLKSSSLNLRGLGPTATLLLVNGRRVQPDGTITAFYDPNFIPAGALQRVEVLLDGASSVYGSDAVGGVVNLITRTRYTGAEMGVRYGFADGLDQWVASANAGRSWSTGGVSIAFEYNNRGRLRGDERDFFTADLRRFGGPDLRSTFANPGNIVVGSGASTVRYAIPVGQNGRGLTAARLVPGTTNLLDPIRFVDYLPHQERVSLVGNLTQEVLPGVQLIYDAYYSSREYNVHQSGTNNGPVTFAATVPNTNPFFVSPVPGATSVRVEYNLVNDSSGPNTLGRTTDWGQSLEAKVDLFAGWRADAFVSRTVARGFTSFTDFINPTRLAAALADSNPATALNLFCDGSVFTCNSRATLASFLGVRTTRSQSSGWQFVAKADGTLFELPGGPLRLAFGVEYNDSRFTYFNEATNTSLDNTLRTIKDLLEQRNVLSGFIEAAAPVFDGLTVSGAVRIDRYSDFGTTTNPRLGVTYIVIPGLRLRGSYGTSFRAPALTERSLAGTNYFIEDVIDPTSPSGRTRALYRTGGNPDLEPETAETWSAGFDVSTQLIPGFQASATYYNVRYTNLIRNLVGFQNVVLAQPQLYSQFVIRNPSAAFVQPFLTSPFLQTAPDLPQNILAFLDLAANNAAALEQTGIDFSADYTHSLGNGDFRIGLVGTKILTQRTQSLPTAPFVDIRDTFGNQASLSLRGNIGFRNDAFAADLFVNHVGPYTNNAGVAGVPLDTRVPSWTTIDATLSFRLAGGGELLGSNGIDGILLVFSAKNLFDRDPPVVLNATQAFDTQNHSILGRFVSVDLRVQF